MIFFAWSRSIAFGDLDVRYTPSGRYRRVHRIISDDAGDRLDRQVGAYRANRFNRRPVVRDVPVMPIGRSKRPSRTTGTENLMKILQAGVGLD
ncbi:MAG TPA: hypothetical protein DDX19_23385 [Rhodopirellula baltica]|uniref:Uncharacterized protein n=2 Tax=Rhodopirellula baltica TaxID=265606 RepID=Q7UNN7_RHOBA|nr:hypothetical protein RBSH_01466 [Rhodopirellula baltica SH28]CAD75381.1 hypothetical protein RB7471 [Rhodopirellula baltica SH 1]HBE65642.1 hypothetical protein [Rhodopirellula baltica]